MARKRTKRLALVLLGSMGLAVSVSGCGGCGPDQDMQKLAAADPVLAKKAAATGAAAGVTDAVSLLTGLIASTPSLGQSAPLNVANLASIIDQADETFDVASNLSGVPRSTNPNQNPPRTSYRYHSGPGIGWFVWGYALGRSSPSPYYSPPRTYSPTPRTFSPTTGGSSGFGRSAPIGGGSGGISRGGFGSSGAAHASGGSS